MPNQLAQSKRRHTLAENAAVLAALTAIARNERTSVMALLRTAAREVVRQRLADPADAAVVRAAIWEKAPRMPVHFRTPAQVARFKRSQREFDQVLRDVRLATPQEIQQSNTIASPHSVKLVDFHRAHDATR